MKDMASLCEQCGKTFVAGNRLKAHIENVHENNKKFICKICKIAFQNIYKLNYHQFKHTDVRTFQCNECDRKFKNRSDLYQVRYIVESLRNPEKLRNSYSSTIRYMTRIKRLSVNSVEKIFKSEALMNYILERMNAYGQAIPVSYATKFSTEDTLSKSI